ncbi:MAG TPA: RNA-binding S4 domain-containing protein [bacterium]|nr:RNA-binding S4 domain-containing protein [bacterium]
MRSEAIDLGALLKLAQVASTGGEAKQLVQAGRVTVNGEVERRRGRQIGPGDRIEAGGQVLVVTRTA